MSNWKKSIPSKYLKASDFTQPALYTISRFNEEEINNELKPVVYFNESEKALVLNIVNGNAIEKICGTPETDEWHGKQIVLYATETTFRGEQVECIRVRAPKIRPVGNTYAPQPEKSFVPPPAPPMHLSEDQGLPF
jgi:hypothetical protein